MNRKSREQYREAAQQSLMHWLRNCAGLATSGPILLGHPLVPHPSESDAELRRTARRLRKHEIHPVDPGITHEELADYYERRIAARAIVHAAVDEMRALSALSDSLSLHDTMANDRAALRALKQNPDLQDPDSGAARLVREIKRARRAMEGRRRRR